MSAPSTLGAPLGDPDALDREVVRFAATAAALERAASDLLALVDSGSGEAVAALRARRLDAETALSRAKERFRESGSALRDYSVELRTYHEVAGGAREAEWTGLVADERATAEMREATMHMATALAGADLAGARHWEERLRDAARDRERAWAQIAEARDTYHAAARNLDEAASAAAARIEAVSATEGEPWWSGLAAVVADAVAWLRASAQWAEGVLRDLLADLADAVTAYATALLVAVVLLVVVGAIAVIALYVSASVVSPEATAAALDALLLGGTVSLAGVDALLDVAGIGSAARVRLLALVASIACPALGFLLVSRVANEALKPPPVVTPLAAAPDASASGVPPMTEDQREALRALDAAVPDDPADLLQWAGTVDTIGGSGQTVIDVARVVDEEGRVSWIVTLPSTKDWVPAGNDQGAVNDLDADLFLMLLPGLASQYERAVLDALRMAGVGLDEPVVLAGWSLGGILAGNLISSGAGGYHYAGLVCGGSPIDHLAIPESVAVLQVKHQNDPVHRTDLIDVGITTAAHREVWDGDRSGAVMSAVKHGNVVGHSAVDYEATLREHLEYARDHGGAEALVDPFRVVLPVDDPATPESVSVEHMQFAVSE